MKLTDALKAWLVEQCGVAKDASNEVFSAKALEALSAGTLSPEKLAELTVEKKTEPGAGAAKLASLIKDALAPVQKELADLKAKQPADADDAAKKAAEDEADKKLQAAIAKAVEDATKSLQTKEIEQPGVTKAGRLFSRAGMESLADPKDVTINVKGAHERYSTTKSAARYDEKHVFAGQQAQFAGKMLDHPSELDKAIAGAYFKFAANASAGNMQVPRGLRMTEHDEQLLKYAINELPWTGIIGGAGTDSGGSKVDGRKLTEFERKSLLDDSTSGGLEAAPIVFDDAVILTPVLHGELFPLVNVVNISRGRRIEGFSMSNPTFTSGVAEGTEIPLFDTESFISAFDTNIYNAVGAMEIGLDFEEDSPVNIGSIVAQRYGEKAMEWLDNQIANGDGTTEPQGFFNASGTASVAFGGVAATVGGYEGLLFGVTKKFRNPADRARSVFVGNEVSYRRARAIPVGASDARRVFGMTHEDYSLLGHPYKIQDDIANTKIAFVNLRYYRMYRRLGMSVRIETGGKELARKNMSLIVVRMRFGGQLELGGSCAITTTAEA